MPAAIKLELLASTLQINEMLEVDSLKSKPWPLSWAIKSYHSAKGFSLFLMHVLYLITKSSNPFSLFHPVQQMSVHIYVFFFLLHACVSHVINPKLSPLMGWLNWDGDSPPKSNVTKLYHLG